MSVLQSTPVANTQPALRWLYVERRFAALQKDLALQQDEIDDGVTKLHGVVKSLNRHFFEESTLDHSFLVGSWRKNTAIRPPSDIDVFFLPSLDVFHQFNTRVGNKQSQLLQHVRDALNVTYPQTRIRGDGQVVVVGFNSIDIEVIPAFPSQGGGYLTCDTNGGGRWKRVEPDAEISELDRVDASFNGNVRKLTRILKQWKHYCNVPIKSFHIEQLVSEALAKLDYGWRDEFWFDWLVRDVFAHMYGRAGGGFFMAGSTYEWIAMSDRWQSKALSAYERASNACDYERQNMNVSAGDEWQKIFGKTIPDMVI
ncbi:hypothetical protein R3X27_12590 [Tropicimonas sp. TH_r6]|uniref:SMODS domain-containing nucleotidyltransferase n=1 Tax=Tropicimonas sp. TH_r6 TaxID=3082085 RepID=UPI002954A6E7|nr:hypothetical protein [Tropicimonas sp. TH_r6]MDV7143518.1 hypothetical protein [Tropicimonas sp. TH_r6]